MCWKVCTHDLESRVLLLLWRWPLCLMTTAFKRDQNQRLKFTAHHPLASFIPYLSTLPVAALWVMKTLQILSGGFEVQIPAGEAERLRDKAWRQGQGRVTSRTVELSRLPTHTELRAAMIRGWREDKKKIGGKAELITHISIGLPLPWPLHTSADTPGNRMNLEFCVHRAGQGWTRLPWRLQYWIQSQACHFLG